MAPPSTFTEEMNNQEAEKKWSSTLKKLQENPSEKPKNLTEMLLEGYPDTLRGRIWCTLAGCPDNKKNLKDFKRDYNPSIDTMQMIEHQVQAAISVLSDFYEKNVKRQESLLRIFNMLTLRIEPVVLMYEGFYIFVAMLVLHMPEEDAYCVALRTADTFSSEKLICTKVKDYTLKLYILNTLVKENLPILWKHFNDIRLDPEAIACRWIDSFFVTVLPLYAVSQIIDVFILQGSTILYQVLIVLLKHSEADLLLLDYKDTIKYVKINVPKKCRGICSTTLIDQALEIDVSNLQQYKEEYILRNKKDSEVINFKIELIRNLEYGTIDVILEHELLKTDLAYCSTEYELSAAKDEIAMLKDERFKLSQKSSQVEQELEELKKVHRVTVSELTEKTLYMEVFRQKFNKSRTKVLELEKELLASESAMTELEEENRDLRLKLAQLQKMVNLSSIPEGENFSFSKEEKSRNEFFTAVQPDNENVNSSKMPQAEFLSLDDLENGTNFSEAVVKPDNENVSSSKTPQAEFLSLDDLENGTNFSEAVVKDM